MYAAGDPSHIIITAYAEIGYQPPSSIQLSRLPAGARNGYLSGEHPDGLTTLEKSPVMASVRVLMRSEGGPNDGCLVGVATSSLAGEWVVSGVSPARQYDVVGRLEGRNDVIASGVTPMPIDRMYTIGQMKPNDEFNGMDGKISVAGGIPPYLMQIVVPPPDGLSIALDRRDILMHGTTSAEPGKYYCLVTITSANGLTLDVEIEIPTAGLGRPEGFTGDLARLFMPTRFGGSILWEEGGPESKTIEDVMRPPDVYYVMPKWDPKLYPPGSPSASIARLFRPTRFNGSIIWKP